MIYLDNAATTQPLDIVIDKMMEVMKEDYGNPSSYHKMGLDAENHIKEASNFFARQLQCSPEEIVYTSGGTESNNMAIIGTALAYKRSGMRIITSKIEHDSVSQAFRFLEEEGFEVIYLDVDTNGYIDKEELSSSINDQTSLVSIMHVNNELGTIQNIEEIGRTIKNKNKNTFFHVDAIQSFAKVPIKRRKSQIDLLSISGHKIYGPKGVGLLYKNKNLLTRPLIHGGGQQRGYRSGTENVAGIVGMHIAAREMISDFDKYTNELYSLKERLANGIINNIEDTYINGPKVKDGAPHILNIGFKDIKSEVLLHALESSNIYVSSGSACSTNRQAHSQSLQSIGRDKEELDEAIRFSLGINNKESDIDQTIIVLKETVPMLRKVLRPGGKRR